MHHLETSCIKSSRPSWGNTRFNSFDPPNPPIQVRGSLGRPFNLLCRLGVAACSVYCWGVHSTSSGHGPFFQPEMAGNMVRHNLWEAWHLIVSQDSGCDFGDSERQQRFKASRIHVFKGKSPGIANTLWYLSVLEKAPPCKSTVNHQPGDLLLLLVQSARDTERERALVNSCPTIDVIKDVHEQVLDL